MIHGYLRLHTQNKKIRVSLSICRARSGGIRTLGSENGPCRSSTSTSDHANPGTTLAGRKSHGRTERKLFLKTAVAGRVPIRDRENSWRNEEPSTRGLVTFRTKLARTSAVSIAKLLSDAHVTNCKYRFKRACRLISAAYAENVRFCFACRRTSPIHHHLNAVATGQAREFRDGASQALVSPFHGILMPHGRRHQPFYVCLAA